MAFACATWSQLTQIVVVLYQRNHAGEQVPALTLFEVAGLHARRAQQYIDPLVVCESFTPFKKCLHVHIGHLDRLELSHRKRRAALVFFKLIFECNDAPDTTYQQFFKLAHIGV